MRGAVFLGNRKIEIRNFPDPTPGPGEVVIEMKASGMCGSDPAYGALRRMQLAGGSTLAVFGQGPVGLSATLLGAKMGARVIAVETNPERLGLAKQFGAEVAVHADDSEKALKDLTRGEGVDLALDCTGIAAARLAAVRSAKTWGTVCFVGEGGDVTLDVSRDLLRKQLTLIGSWTFSAMGQAECARFVADNGIELEKIFSHRWKLEQADEAYRTFDSQSTGKGVIVF